MKSKEGREGREILEDLVPTHLFSFLSFSLFSLSLLSLSFLSLSLSSHEMTEKSEGKRKNLILHPFPFGFGIRERRRWIPDDGSFSFLLQGESFAREREKREREKERERKRMRCERNEFCSNIPIERSEWRKKLLLSFPFFTSFPSSSLLLYSQFSFFSTLHFLYSFFLSFSSSVFYAFVICSSFT